MRKTLYFLCGLFLFFGFYACEEVLFEEDLTNKEVILLAPSENAIITDSIVNFSWNTLQGAFEYQLQVATPNFSTSTQIVFDSTLVDTINSNSQQLLLLLTDNDYEWRVRAFNGSSQTEYFTNPFSVQTEVFVEDISNETVTLVAPSDNSTLDIREITFTWEEVEFAEEYTLQIATPDFTNPTQVVVDTITAQTSSRHSLENGSYEWRVKAQNSASETSFSTNGFIVDALTFNEDISSETVTIIAPPEGATLTVSEINFTWEAVDFAEDYQLQIATPNFTNPSQVVVDEILSGTTSTQTLADGTYEWRVKARNSESQTAFTTTGFTVAIDDDMDISNQTVQLIAPSDGSVLDIQDINFTWQGVTNAEEYFIEIATPNFTNPTQSFQNTVSNTSFMQSLDDGEYEWRVQARNSSSQTPFSDINAFTVATQTNFPDREVIIISPPDNFVSNQASLNIQWQVVQDATLYRIQVLDATTNALLDEQTTTQINIPFTFPEGNLLWQVRAETASENTQYTTQNITIDTQAPNTPTLLTPNDTDIVNSTSVTFTWDRTPIAGTAEQDMIYIYDDVGLTNLILQENVSGGSFTTSLNDDTTYYWFMNANDAAGNVSADSPVFSFSIDE
jgi:uncharacterized protein YegP (UPF0339 family)